ncbi:protocatechuate 3,4-dioxygenase subunit alpha [Amycolatopsis cihanbeyliensis]|uniref:Protocatechuate 3,4-dioxygenase alpha subunit n=1 Tax=Amycolatopsis cihanbeyliensis TaxID=1128664 RepID=A0A542CUB6_AMYCI|nr:protocatechuate 3,4-dioxygenase subunit alpha [Amycolatopsis cihanbeyliensis]TQI94409.1 protocatechuate 3,4-dioxygenase alpha subunit [Amycolatopsis cihanbeyliensis]
MNLGSTPSQTVGPFLSIGLPWTDGPAVTADEGADTVWIKGVVSDGAGEPVPDALVETWQADRDGRFDHPDDPRGAVPGFRGFGRCPTEPDGSYAIRTVLPGALPGQAPHIDVSVFARGLLQRVVTRIYFPEHAEQHRTDPVLAAVPAGRRDTLIAVPTAGGYRFDVRLQGEGETVFFDV